MKTIQNTKKVLTGSIFTFFLALSVIIISCSKPENGTNGIDGTNGATGATGTSGTNGNANVKQFTFGTRTFNSLIDYEVSSVTQAELDNSVILCYYKMGNFWYSAPGIGISGNFQVRTFFDISTNNLRCSNQLFTLSGSFYSTAVTWANFRVIIIPVSSNVNLARSSSNLDFTKMSYSEVCKYLKIAE